MDTGHACLWRWRHPGHVILWRADGGARDTGADDPEAGELGKPFIHAARGFGDGEKGDQEEWAGWVDWDALAGGAAGGSGSGS